MRYSSLSVTEIRQPRHLHTSRRHLLVTNDFPPKFGGIQNYLYEIYRRLPAQDVAVLTSSYPGDDAFDARAPFEVIRLERKWLLPTRPLVQLVTELISDMGAETLAVDPALPLGAIAGRLPLACTLVVHGAEVVIPAKLPILRSRLAAVVRSSNGIVAAGEYTLSALDKYRGSPFGGSFRASIVPPGVDTERFHPLGEKERRELRERMGYREGDFVVVGISRLVPRKGMDTLIDACAIAAREVGGLRLVIGGEGRDGPRLKRRAESKQLAVTFTGRLSDPEMVELYQVADLFAMLCRNRWFGLEQEGFGIVFLEAAACGVPQLAGRSGGASEAVEDGVSGFIIEEPKNAALVAARILQLARDPELRFKLGDQARLRAKRHFDYGALAQLYAKHFGL